VKRIAQYQPLPTRYNLKREHILLLLSFMSYPMPSEVEEYAEMTGQAFVALGVFQPEKMEAWREVLHHWRDSNVVWTEEPIGVWTHPWSCRNAINPTRLAISAEISNLLRADLFP
jgi:hypothetical protein